MSNHVDIQITSSDNVKHYRSRKHGALEFFEGGNTFYDLIKELRIKNIIEIPKDSKVYSNALKTTLEHHDLQLH